MEILKIPCRVKVYTTFSFNPYIFNLNEAKDQVHRTDTALEIMDNTGNWHCFPTDKINKVDYIYTATETASTFALIVGGNCYGQSNRSINETQERLSD